MVDEHSHVARSKHTTQDGIKSVIQHCDFGVAQVSNPCACGISQDFENDGLSRFIHDAIVNHNFDEIRLPANFLGVQALSFRMIVLFFPSSLPTLRVSTQKRKGHKGSIYLDPGDIDPLHPDGLPSRRVPHPKNPTPTVLPPPAHT